MVIAALSLHAGHRRDLLAATGSTLSTEPIGGSGQMRSAVFARLTVDPGLTRGRRVLQREYQLHKASAAAIIDAR